jgi:hypothetical protein
MPNGSCLSCNGSNRACWIRSNGLNMSHLDLNESNK